MTPARLEKAELVELPDMDGPEVTEAEALEAAQAAGLSLVNLRRVRHYRKIGRYLTKEGLVMVARGKLAGRAEALERARERLTALLDKEFYDDSGSENAKTIGETTAQMMVSLAKAIAEVSTVENNTAELDLKLDKIARDDAPKAAPSNRAPPPGASVHMTGTLELKPAEAKQIVVQ